MVTGPRAAAVIFGALLVAAPAGGNPLCRAELSLEPDPAFVGEPVLYRLRILRGPDVSQVSWEKSPHFPDLRAEWIPGRTADDPVVLDGTSYLVYDERRMLFSAQAGEQIIPRAALLCQRRESSEAGPADQVAPIPERTLQVLEPPETGRPEGWRGLVGRVEVGSLVEPRRVALGDTVRISVRIEGEGNLWNVPSPFPDEEAIDGAELFPLRPTLAHDRGRRLRLRHYFSYDLVPRRTGLLKVPAVHLPYFDPSTKRYARASVPEITVEVVDAVKAAGRLASLAPGARQATHGDENAGNDANGGTWLAGVFLLTALGAGVFFWRHRRARSAGLRQARALLSDAAIDAASAGRALRLALSSRIADAFQLTPEEILARCDSAAEREAAACLSELESSRFSGETLSAPIESARRVLERLSS